MEKAAMHFQYEGTPVECKAFGNGHINRSLMVKTDSGKKYVLQSLSTVVFKDIPGLMGNVSAVSNYIASKNPDPRGSLHFVQADDGNYWFLDESGEYWRSYEFVDSTFTFEPPFGPDEFRASAVAFGTFQNQLADFPAETLVETIPHFHDTPDRFRQFREKIAEDPCGRAESVRDEIGFLLSRENAGSELQHLRDSGVLPLRVTHNDTKINNVLFDSETKEPVCVIDLDTVMPGLSALDFGDAIRFGASTGAEDEKDLSRVNFDIDMFRAFAEGFISACPNLTQSEIDALALGAKTITLENAVRFLTDYLDGDHYYSISYPEHNLDRTRTHIKLVSDMEKQWDDMLNVIRSVAAAER